LVGNCVAVKRC